MNLESLLTSLPVEQWRVETLYALDWHDGPRSGVCALSVPGGEFYFELLDERYNPDGLEDRLYRLTELPAGSVPLVVSASQELANPDPLMRRRAERQVEEVLASGRPSTLVLHSQNMRQFLGLWDDAGTDRNGTDWFTRLSVPQGERAV